MKKTHEAWDCLKPNENEKYQDFRFEEYYQRVSTIESLNHIPKAVFEQWLYPFHQDDNTLNNYGWINYENIQFNLCGWEVTHFENIHVIKNYMDYYSDRSSYSDFNQFGCINEDLKNWKEMGTWRVPPIILDVTSLQESIPLWSDIESPYQLVEGHTRLGYLNSLKRITSLNKGQVAAKHLIYLMQENDN